jgi:hypothetical protein
MILVDVLGYVVRGVANLPDEDGDSQATTHELKSREFHSKVKKKSHQIRSRQVEDIRLVQHLRAEVGFLPKAQYPTFVV